MYYIRCTIVHGVDLENSWASIKPRVELWEYTCSLGEGSSCNRNRSFLLTSTSTPAGGKMMKALLSHLLSREAITIAGRGPRGQVEWMNRGAREVEARCLLSMPHLASY